MGEDQGGVAGTVGEAGSRSYIPLMPFFSCVVAPSLVAWNLAAATPPPSPAGLPIDDRPEHPLEHLPSYSLTASGTANSHVVMYSRTFDAELSVPIGPPSGQQIAGQARAAPSEYWLHQFVAARAWVAGRGDLTLPVRFTACNRPGNRC
jgi:hypothetical protein